MLGTDQASAFERWSSLGGAKMRAELLRAAETLTSIAVEHGFEVKSKAFDSSDPPPYALNLEKNLPTGETNFIYIGFDKHHRARFQVLFGTKGTPPPHHWVRSGVLVCKQGGALHEHRWWGPKWWQPNKVKVFRDQALEAAKLTPQILEYLSKGVAGSHIAVELGN